METITFPKIIAQTVLKQKIIKSTCKTHGVENTTVYGIEVFFSGEINNYAIIEDISTNPCEVKDLMLRLKKRKNNPEQLTYIVEDYIEELSIL